MTFGRWLLVHSFSIFLVGLLLFGYLYREELQLEQAYQQLLNLDDAENVVGVLSTRSDAAKPEISAAQSEPSASGKPVSREEVAATVSSTEPEPRASSSEMEVDAKPTVDQPHLQPRQQLLMSARQAFWDRDFRTSVERYRDLLSKHPQDPDYNGELGNVYYAMNDYERAAQQYYRAALILREQNQVEAARQLVSPVTAMDRALGDRLRSQLLR